MKNGGKQFERSGKPVKKLEHQVIPSSALQLLPDDRDGFVEREQERVSHS
jgi:hypothetical protein